MSRYQSRRRWLASVAVAITCAAGCAWAVRGFLTSDPLERGWRAYSEGNWEDAIKVAREQLEVNGDDTKALRLLARTSIRLGRDSSAMALYNRIGSNAMTAEDLCLLGIALTRSGNERALEVWEQARAAEPNHAETLYELTQAYLKKDRLDDAVKSAQKLAACPGWKSQAEALLGSIAFARDNPADAVGFWKSALEHQASETKNDHAISIAPEELARALLQTRQPEAARQYLVDASASEATPKIFWLLSRAYLQEGDKNKALAASDKAGSFRADNPLLPEPSPFAGTSRCAECHSAIFQIQQSSRHAHTFYHSTELTNLPLPQSPLPDPGQANVLHKLKRTAPNVIEQQTEVKDQIYSAVVEYAFGSGDRGLTLVARGNKGQAYELRLSQYRDGTSHRWDVTSGHLRKPDDATRFLGEPLTGDAVRRCLSCHVTSAQAIMTASGPAAFDHGIACEKCHGPGENHILAIEAKFPDRAIIDPRLASGSQVVSLCAECHSPRGRTVARDDPAAVRFQGTTLTWSRCFLESQDTLDCITCHDPHRNAVKSNAHYEEKCLSCHSGTRQPRGRHSRLDQEPLPSTPARTICPVNPQKDCIGCHMPSVKDIVPHSSFTDHFIRVHRD